MAKLVRSSRSSSIKKKKAGSSKVQSARPVARKKSSRGLEMGVKLKAQPSVPSRKSAERGSAPRGSLRAGAKASVSSPRGLSKAQGRTQKASSKTQSSAASRMSKRASQVKRAIKKGFSELVKVGS
ncbi:hypothetical protein EBS43_11310 [bacterium]|jgi:hypothetical protein|nr:hypothetical protein [bacterium]